ncbi:MAG: hypothetical protein A3J37_04435 [Alphaproteobacteria bacterium RIFCSPHIGHO2_12_FULL_45_9]|nr:MAG: hypothetical protein A3B66_00480 [Alphaproteobacteria bacterium RIFCSPHIGHO2_02_FULL_46_13]OFW98271.1 MAG: hypothetical protein A3J37_04435 [Alphaproteobacteria bacterium RIFCSPHIGHO2_12_FULL_45_9]
MPASASFIENLVKLEARGVKAGALTVLRDAGERLEALGKLAINNGGKLKGAEEAEFRKIYSDYVRESLASRRALKGAGALDEARATAEIRDDFFNGTLGHLGKNNDERALLRLTLNRKAVEATGLEISLQGGKGKVAKAEYENLRTISKSESEFLDEAMKAKWKLVNDNEKALLSQAKREATTDGASASARETAKNKAAEAQREIAAQRERDAAQNAEKRASQQKAALEISAVRGSALDDVENAVKSRDPDQIAEKFSALRSKMAEKEPGSIVDQVRQQDLTPDQIMHELRNGQPVSRKELMDLEEYFVRGTMAQQRLSVLDKISIRPNSSLGMDTDKVFDGLRNLLNRENLLSDAAIERRYPLTPKNIYDSLREGQPISRDELNTLESFYRKNFDTKITAPAPQQPLPNNAHMLPQAGAGKVMPYLNSILQVGSNIINSARKGETVGRMTSNVMHEWETGTQPNILARFGNNLSDGTGYTRSATVALLTTTALLGGNRYLYYHPEGMSTGFSTGLFEAGYFTDKAFDNVPAEVINRQYDRLTKDSASRERFKDYTSLITGINIKDGEEGDLEKLLEIARVLDSSGLKGVTDPKQNKRSAEFKERGLTGNDVTAYALAVGFYAGERDVDVLLGKDAKGENTSTGLTANILNITRNKLVTNLANKYNNPVTDADIAARDKAFRDFLGVPTLPATNQEVKEALLQAYASRAGQAKSDVSTLVIGEYLVLANVLKPEQKNANAAQAVIAENTEALGKSQTASKEARLADLSRSGTELFTGIGAASGGAPEAAQAEATSCSVKVPSRDKLAEILDNASTVTNVPLATLQAAFVKSVKDGCVDADRVQNELNKVVPQQASRATGWIMKGLSEGPSN